MVLLGSGGGSSGAETLSWKAKQPVKKPRQLHSPGAVTLLELLVVLLIISILSTIAVGVFTKEVTRAKIAKARAEIAAIEIAVARYQIDTGMFPPSSTGTALPPSGLNPDVPYRGSGYLQVALRGSLNGDANAPLSERWRGPYLEWDENRIGPFAGLAAVTSKAELSYLDPWGNPYYYASSEEYDLVGATRLPLTSLYAATETYYNASTVQIFSLGPNGRTSLVAGELGEEPDDITNWKSGNY